MVPTVYLVVLGVAMRKNFEGFYGRAPETNASKRTGFLAYLTDAIFFVATKYSTCAKAVLHQFPLSPST